MNERNEVAFDGFIKGPPPTSGVFVRDAHQTSAIAFGVNPDRSGPSFGLTFNPFITRHGDVVFEDNFGSIFFNNGKTILPIVRVGGSAAGGGMEERRTMAFFEATAAASRPYS